MLQSRFVVDLLLGLLAVAVGVVGAAVAVAVASRTATVFFPEWHSRFRENAAPHIYFLLSFQTASTDLDTSTSSSREERRHEKSQNGEVDYKKVRVEPTTLYYRNPLLPCCNDLTLDHGCVTYEDNWQWIKQEKKHALN